MEEDASFRVFVTINALSYVSWNGNLQSRKLELNWTPPPDGVQDQDQIRLYRRHPEEGEQTRLLVRIRARDHDGYFKTQVSFPRNPMMGIRSPKANCLYGFWIAYIRDERTLKANCIRVRPEWMYEHRHVIGEIPLHGNFLQQILTKFVTVLIHIFSTYVQICNFAALMIPGTHNSGAYDVNFGVSKKFHF